MQPKAIESTYAMISFAVQYFGKVHDGLVGDATFPLAGPHGDRAGSP
jgi:hypothetical protein